VSIAIPFNKPYVSGNEQKYISEAIESGHLSGDGRFTKKCKSILEQALQAKSVLLTTSCTHALEMSALLLDLKPGDEVIVPSFTFVSTINAFILRGVRPVFADIKRDTKNLDERTLERLITPRTRAIVPVHYAGVGCEMDKIMSLAKANNVAVVEDNAHGLFGKFKGQLLGSFGELSTLSFHETKNFQCGEGGALVINKPELSERAEIIREKGTNRARFFRGQVDKYSWVDIGSSYLPSEMLAAFLCAQLEERVTIQNKRQSMWDTYQAELGDWAQANGVELPFVPDYCDQSYHMFYIILPSLDARHQLIDHLKKNGILSVFHYLPLHCSDMGVKYGYKPGDCPVTEYVSDRLLRLPFFNSLSQQEQSKVIACIKEFKIEHGALASQLTSAK
jgi:dTDP-4-amino-4,6-dideoxygalactose transaminase